MLDRVRRWIAEFRAACSYVTDPHGWELRIRQAQQSKTQPRPAIFQMGDRFIVHPALEARLRREMPSTMETLGTLSPFGMQLYVSVFAVEQPPEGGWPDVVVPERPRLRP